MEGLVEVAHSLVVLFLAIESIPEVVLPTVVHTVVLEGTAVEYFGFIVFPFLKATVAVAQLTTVGLGEGFTHETHKKNYTYCECLFHCYFSSNSFHFLFLLS